MDESLPEVTMTAPLRQEVTRVGGNVNFDGGSVSFPNGAIMGSQPVEFITSFHMPHEMPLGVESVSPAVLVRTAEELRKEVQLTLHHNSNLKTAQDSKDMMFLTASTTPEDSTYKFTELKGAKPNFNPLKKIGSIKMKIQSIWVEVGRKRKKGATHGEPLCIIALLTRGLQSVYSFQQTGYACVSTLNPGSYPGSVAAAGLQFCSS
jgi:hypothetical protein